MSYQTRSLCQVPRTSRFREWTVVFLYGPPATSFVGAGSFGYVLSFAVGAERKNP